MDDIRNRIKKLLNLAECDGATQGEIENALRFADRLMAEHNLSRAQVVESDGHTKAAELERIDREHAYAQGANHTNWECSLARYVGEMIGGVYYYSAQAAPVVNSVGMRSFDANGNSITKARFCFYGDAEGVQIARETFADLGRTIAAMARLKYGGAFRGNGRAYAEGFVAGLWQKMKEDRQAQHADPAKAVAAAPGAMIITNQQRAVLDRWHEKGEDQAKAWLVKEHNIKLQNRSRGGNRNDPGAFGNGRSDGSRANVSRGRAPKLGGGGYARMLN